MRTWLQEKVEQFNPFVKVCARKVGEDDGGSTHLESVEATRIASNDEQARTLMFFPVKYGVSSYTIHW